MTLGKKVDIGDAPKELRDDTLKLLKRKARFENFFHDNVAELQVAFGVAAAFSFFSAFAFSEANLYWLFGLGVAGLITSGLARSEVDAYYRQEMRVRDYWQGKGWTFEIMSGEIMIFIFTDDDP